MSENSTALGIYIPKRFLCLFLAPEHDSVVGDLEEEYFDRVESSGPILATLIYWAQTLKLIPSIFTVTVAWSVIMLKNYLTITFRTLLRYKSFSAINILGLAIGMPVCLLAILAVRAQSGMDEFHAHKDRIYRVTTRTTDTASGHSLNLATAPALVFQTLRDEYLGVEDGVQLTRFGGDAKYGDKVLSVAGHFASPSFFTVFSFDLKTGDPKSVLDKPFSMVISQETSRRFFGHDNPIGKTLAFSFGDFVVTGLLSELSEGELSHIKADVLVSPSTLSALRSRGLHVANPQDWQEHSSFYNYVLLSESQSLASLNRALPEINARFSRGEDRYSYEFGLQGLTEIVFGPELANEIGTVMPLVVVYLFLTISVILMLPAIFNYVSLTIARSLKRAKEIGVRKVAGANRAQIVRQFLAESVVITLLSLIPAFFLLYWLLPAFNQFDFIEYLSLGWTEDWIVYTLFIAFAVFLGVVAGFLPSIYMSSMLPVQTLKGLTRIKGFSGLTLRKTLLVVQFALSLLIIINTMLIQRQFKFMLKADYGFQKEDVVTVSLQNAPYETFRNELLGDSNVKSVTAVSRIIGRVTDRPTLPLKSANVKEPIKAIPLAIDLDFLSSLDFKLVAGRNFSREFSTDSTSAVILNETAVARLGYANAQVAVGEVIAVEAGEMQVIGVVQDFHYARLHRAIQPVVLQYDPSQFHFAMVHVVPGDLNERLATIESAWQKVSGSHELFHFRLLDDYVLAAYNDGKDIVTFLSIIAGLGIFIACLGLLGMAIYSTESRIKEIGIRKVLGASAGKIVFLLSRDMVKLLAIAVLVASALAWAFVSNVFMTQFPYRVEVGPGIFLLGIALVSVLALITIGSQTFKAAATNPAETLRNE